MFFNYSGDDITRVCELSEYGCYSIAYAYMLTTETGKSNNTKDRCNCLNPCNYITYDYVLTDKFLGLDLIDRKVNLIQLKF